MSAVARGLACVLQCALAAVFCAGVARASPLLLSAVGTSQKVCQVDGDVDWETGAPTAARTLTNAGLDAADLGYPVEYHGSLILLFGDSWPSHPKGPGGEVSPNDAVGVTTRTATPTSSACLGLRVLHRPTTPPRFMPATVFPAGFVKQGWFNVPSGGVSVDGILDAFFWTNHCSHPHKLSPSPSAPLARPAGDPSCPETNRRNSVGANVFAQSTDGGRTFHNPVVMPVGFVYDVGVDATSIAGLPPQQRLGVYVLGVPRYRASIPYLAYAPSGTIANPSAWRYFTGRNASGNPIWVSYGVWRHGAPPATWSPPGKAEIVAASSPSDRCIGEFSVTWNEELRAWLMLYGCHFSIEARVAPALWGPWSAPATLLSHGPAVDCRLIMVPAGCGARRNYWPLRGGSYVGGAFYAPFVLNRYTTAAGMRSATIYWVVSTWNPYEVDVMRSTLNVGP